MGSLAARSRRWGWRGKQFMDSIMIELIEIAMGFNRNR